MLKKEPTERYNSAIEIINDLEMIKLPEEEKQEFLMEDIQEQKMDLS